MSKFDIFQEKFTRTLGSFKPRFEGKPADYWELNNFDVWTSCGLLLLTIGVFVALSIGCMYWIVRESSQQFALAWSIIMIFGLFLFLYFSYSCSKSKKSVQDKLIKQSIAKQQKRSWKVQDKNMIKQQDQTSLMHLN